MTPAGDLLELLQRSDDKPALIEAGSGRALSHAELAAEIQLVADQLAGLGVGPGDRVGMILGNSPQLIVAFLAIVSVGASVAPLNPAFSAAEVRGELTDLGVGTLLYAEPAVDAATSAASGLDLPHARLDVDGDGHVVIEGAEPKTEPTQP